MEYVKEALDDTIVRILERKKLASVHDHVVHLVDL